MVAIVECVPNFSEGRNQAVIDKIANSAKNIDGARILGIEPDPDYNRTVLTIAGDPTAVKIAAFNVIKSAYENIDMTKHKGEHPRLGAVDVCPFIPIKNSTMEDCSKLAKELAIQVSEELLLPTYLYGYAANSSDRELLSDIRRGEYEGLKQRLDNDGPLLPDYGPKSWNDKIEKFGAVVIGARKILVAYNVNLNEKDAAVAKKVGTIIRSSGRLIKNEHGDKLRINGMLEMVQGMGLPLETHGISQVSMNLRDVSITPMHVAYEAVKTIAHDHGVELCGSELVGLVPLDTMIEAGKWYSGNDSLSESDLVQWAIDGLGLASLYEFNPKERIIEWAIEGGQ